MNRLALQPAPLSFDAGLTVGIVAIVVGFVGIVIAIWLARDQSEDLKQVHREQLAKVEEVGEMELQMVRRVRNDLNSTLGQLQGEIATRYVGRFPDFLGEIIDVIGKAEKELTIFCDLPAYGVVSTPKNFNRYMEAIEAKLRDDEIELHMVHLGKTARRAGLDIQFGSDWSETKKQKPVIAFVKACRRKIDSITQDQFFDLVELEQEKALERFIHAARGKRLDATQTEAIMPLYYWIADRKAAVFALSQFRRGIHEAGFRTRSENLIDAMLGIRERYAEQAQVGPPSPARSAHKR